MQFSILIPHYKNGKATAYALAQLLKYKGHHELQILIVDNNSGDGSTKYFEPFAGSFEYYEYPKDRIQSHGCGYDFLMPYVKNEWVVTMESDSFPTSEKWLDKFEEEIRYGFKCIGSTLQLSGGNYLHPAGSLYNKKIWEQAKEYCDNIPYHYFPNMAMKEGFACHLMVHKSIVNALLSKPEDYIELAEGYKPYFPQKAEAQATHYFPVRGPFHNGMGGLQESIKTYSQRSYWTDVPTILLNEKQKLIKRIGYEPGQWLYFWQQAMGYKILDLPCEIKWLQGREGQQQEYTLTCSGFKHLWAGSAYLDMKGTEMSDVYEFKKNQIEELYNSLPEHQKINDGIV